MKYDKPHLAYDEQLKRLADRGMVYDDQAEAVRALKYVGYYRLSAYTYPFREFSEQDEHGKPVGPRPDTFQSGSRFADAVALHEFDQKLRRCLSNGLEEVELGLRTQIAYHLGKADPFGHLDASWLDPPACDEKVDRDGTTGYDRFLHIFDQQRHESRNEEFVKHFIAKYDGEMPVWAAAEIMSFGLLVRLYGLLGAREGDKIAELLGVRDRALVHKYLKGLNVLRNDCAHHCRVWNRSTIYPPKKPPKNLTHERLHHLRDADPNRVYPLAALTAHFAICVSPATNWPRKFKEVMKSFPAPLGMTPELQMGFPTKWLEQPMWSYDSRASR
jgi:abortive infection bacteriophage resistance protein